MESWKSSEWLCHATSLEMVHARRVLSWAQELPVKVAPVHSKSTSGLLGGERLQTGTLWAAVGTSRDVGRSDWLELGEEGKQSQDCCQSQDWWGPRRGQKCRGSGLAW